MTSGILGHVDTAEISHKGGPIDMKGPWSLPVRKWLNKFNWYASSQCLWQPISDRDTKEVVYIAQRSAVLAAQGTSPIISLLRISTSAVSKFIPGREWGPLSLSLEKVVVSCGPRSVFVIIKIATNQQIDLGFGNKKWEFPKS